MPRLLKIVRAKTDTSRALGRGVIAVGIPSGASAPLGQPPFPDLETVLFPADGNNGFDEDVKKALKLLLDKGAMGAGAMYTPDCRATYEELKAKGVQFKSEPKEQFYGIGAIITDGCCNWFSMTQPKEMLAGGWK